MLKNIPFENILFLDIETVSQHQHFTELSPEWQHLWERKSATLKRDDNQTPADIYNRAAIYAEFGKIVCISCGYLNYNNGKNFRIKSFYGDEEKVLLKDFCEMLTKHFSKSEQLLCAHNGKEFDFPYIARRCIINGLPIPPLLDSAGKKPWEVQHFDTMELWKFGDFKSFTSLNLLATALNVPTPKDDIDGSQVYGVYYEEKNIERIATYCGKDVLTVAQILLRFKGEPLLKEHEIIFAD